MLIQPQSMVQFLKSLKKSAVKNFELELLPIIDGNKDGKVYNEDINIFN